VRDIVSGLGEPPVADIEIQEITGEEEANTFRPSRKRFPAQVIPPAKGRRDGLDELSMLWVVRGIFVFAKDLLQTGRSPRHACPPLRRKPALVSRPTHPVHRRASPFDDEPRHAHSPSPRPL